MIVPEIPDLPTDFWGIVMPAWVGAIGGLFSAVIGVIAFVLSLRNRRATSAIAGGLNSEQGSERAARGVGTPTVTQTEPETQRPTRVRWRVERSGKSYLLINASDRSVVLNEADDVSEGDQPFTLLQNLPTTVAPGDSLPFIISKSIVSSPVTAIRLRWEDNDESASVVIYV